MELHGLVRGDRGFPTRASQELQNGLAGRSRNSLLASCGVIGSVVAALPPFQGWLGHIDFPRACARDLFWRRFAACVHCWTGEISPSMGLEPVQHSLLKFFGRD